MNYLLNQSLNESIPVTIIYQSKDNSFSKRTVLVKSRNETYIRAYCYTKRQIRIFKIDSILAVEPMKRRAKSYA
ncbi:WYL domain-containing protein [Robertmurraya massiliosenegalensis]|uniref:WYL domain-containing protein n=1 Tax=Robertmurraya TaxID=2837507 RepID=UPI0039A493B1